MRVLFISAAILALAGCASQEPVVASSTTPVLVASTSTEVTTKTKVVCHKVSDTGSSMIHSVCETESTDGDRNALQEQMRNNLPNNSIAHPAAGAAIK